MAENQTNQSSLIRGLGLIAAISVIVATVIGTGVFAKARIMTCNVGSPFWVIAVWVFAGVLSLAGALTYAELSAMMPKAGGEVVFLRNAYGRLWSFLYGWMTIFIAKTGSQAAVAVLGAGFLNDLLGGSLKKTLATFPIFGTTFELTTLQIVAVGAILFFTTLNCLDVKSSGTIATFLTAIKIGLVLFVGLGAFLLASGDWSHYSMIAEGGKCEGVSGAKLFGSESYIFTAGLAAAMLGALWGYDGWNNLTLVAGEIKDPQRNIPRALIGGTCLIMFLYILANLAYFYVLTPTEIANISKDSSVAFEAAKKYLPAGVVGLMTVALMASALGTLHSSLLTGARVPYAMAQDGTFFKAFGRLSASAVPVTSVIAQGVWACVLALSGSFDTLTDYVIFGSWIFYALATASVFVFRKKMPDAPRPYKAWGYPVVPVLFLLVAGWLLFDTVWNSTQQSMIGIILIALGLPFYYYFNRHTSVPPADLSSDNT